VEEKGELNAVDAKAVFEELSEERLSSAPANASAALQSEFLDSPEPAGYGPADSHRQPVFEDTESLLRNPREVVTPPSRQAIPDDPGVPPQSRQEPVFEQAESLLRDPHEAVAPPPRQAIPDEPGVPPQSRQEPVFANAENLLRDQHKVVMPPPQKVAPVGTDDRFVPTMEETFGSYADPQPPPPPRPQPRHLRDPGFDAYGPVPETTYPRRPPRAPRRPVYGYLFLILTLLGAGAFAWYQFDGRDAVAKLGRQLDNFFPPVTESAPVAAERMSGQGGATPAATDTGAK
jgi:hypothetical protein